MKSLKSTIATIDTLAYWDIDDTVEYGIIECIRDNLNRKIINISRKHMYWMVYDDICPLEKEI
jgi:hypothetical protein